MSTNLYPHSMFDDDDNGDSWALRTQLRRGDTDQCTLLDLPVELLLFLIKNFVLDFRDACRLEATCRTLYKLVRSEFVWPHHLDLGDADTTPGGGASCGATNSRVWDTRRLNSLMEHPLRRASVQCIWVAHSRLFCLCERRKQLHIPCPHHFLPHQAYCPETNGHTLVSLASVLWLCPNVTRLRLPVCIYRPSALPAMHIPGGLAILCATCPNLRSLTLDGECDHLNRPTDSNPSTPPPVCMGLDCLSTVQFLTLMNIADSAADITASLIGLSRRLRRLSLMLCTNLRVDAFLASVEKLPQLQMLELVAMRGTSRDTLSRIQACCGPTLTELSLHLPDMPPILEAVSVMRFDEFPVLALLSCGDVTAITMAAFDPVPLSSPHRDGTMLIQHGDRKIYVSDQA